MGIFGKSAQQKRIDADAVTIAGLRNGIDRLVAENDRLAKMLRNEQATNDALDRTAKKYRQERDEYKPDALKHRASRANLKQYQPKPNGTAAAVQGVAG